MSIDFILNISPSVLAKEMPTQRQCLVWFQAALPPEITQAEVTLKIVDKEEGASLNRQYREKQGPTNVLSFPYKVPGQPHSRVLGDLVICAALVAEEATLMEGLEIHILQQLGFPSPYGDMT
jgi:probable rRNA maturation factor